MGVRDGLSAFSAEPFCHTRSPDLSHPDAKTARTMTHTGNRPRRLMGFSP